MLTVVVVLGDLCGAGSNSDYDTRNWTGYPMSRHKAERRQGAAAGKGDFGPVAKAEALSCER